MGRGIGPKNKIARRFGTNLGLKSNPVKVARRLSQPPGAHGAKKRAGAAQSSYGRQLLEKQKAKHIYGMREGQFRRFVEKSIAAGGDSGVNLLRLLETRLDNVVYRLGFADTRAQARQMVSHSMFLLNDKNINIPSHNVKTGDAISLKPSKAKKRIFENISEKLEKKNLPSWLAVDAAKMGGKVLNLPSEKDFERIFDVRQIIEFYSAR